MLSNNNSFTKTVSVYNVENGKLLSNLSPNNYFTNPHDIAVSINGEYCYVVELYPHKIWKFKIGEFNIVYSNKYYKNII